jgi:peptidoglycan/LPS O-acetylase OafA/YrhL
MKGKTGGHRTANGRLLVFDLLRVLAIVLIVVRHLAGELGWAAFNAPYWWNDIFLVSVGNVGVLIFILVSGAVLELQYRPFENVEEYLRFVYRRFFRIYPAMWLSLVFAIIIALCAGTKINLITLFWSFTGFVSFAGLRFGQVNQVIWYIGLLMTFYFVYPPLHELIDKKPYISVIVLFAVSLVSTYIINIMTPNIGFVNDSYIAKWFPLCTVFYFALGIFLVRMGWYPRWQERRGIWQWLGELSFYVFLFHYPLLNLADKSVILFLTVTCIVSCFFMAIDKKIQAALHRFITGTETNPSS